MAGQAIIQATLESALPLAQADASIFAQFEVQNLSNRQQRSMLSAQQRASFLGLDFDQGFQTRVQNAGRISDIANLNFTADQQIQLENSRVTYQIVSKRSCSKTSKLFSRCLQIKLPLMQPHSLMLAQRIKLINSFLL